MRSRPFWLTSCGPVLVGHYPPTVALGPRWGATTGPWLRGLPGVSPWAPGAAGAALQRPLGDPLPAGGAGPGLPDARSYGANEEIEPHPQAREDGTEHHGPLGALAAARLSSIAPGMSSQRGPNLRRPRRGARPRGPGRGPRRPPEQAGPARVPASASGSSCRRCTPVPRARRALLVEHLWMKSHGRVAGRFLISAQAGTRVSLGISGARLDRKPSCAVRTFDGVR